MDTSVFTLIGSYGFPIVACCAMGWYTKYISDQNNKTIADLNAAHKAEMDSLSTALANNTVAITKLCDKLDAGK